MVRLVARHARPDEGRRPQAQPLLYESLAGAPVTLIHDGGHAFPSAAPPLIARFFREAGPKKQ